MRGDDARPPTIQRVWSLSLIVDLTQIIFASPSFALIAILTCPAKLGQSEQEFCTYGLGWGQGEFDESVEVP
jgi:hypothetical protein